MAVFNNREIATAIWLLVIILWILSRSETRSSASNVFRAACTPKLLAPVLIAALSTSAFVFILYRFGWWTFSELKDTIIWFCFTGVSLLFRGLGTSDSALAVRGTIRDSIKIILVVEFLVNSYTFPLTVELLLIPIFTLLAMLQVIAELKKEYAPTASFLKVVQAIFGWGILGFVLWSFIHQANQVWSRSGLRSFILPILLSIAYFPLAYAMALLSAYEQLFLPLKIGKHKQSKVIRYAKLKAFTTLGLSLRRVHQAHRNLGFALGQVDTIDDVDHAFSKLHNLKNSK